MSEDCIFCKIVKKQADATIIYEDPETLAFMDIAPLNHGHTLVITKTHYPNIMETPPEKVGKLFTVVARLAKAVQKATNADGISIGQSNGRAASQEVFHIHVHIIPRYDHEMMFPERKKTDRKELEEVGRKIREAIAKSSR
ncbi:MAG TPA: HIT family protein [Candidatus Bathyarchaeia archaeon]|nr:HIT family protein [Candidatus Bathyarchaeia archaeon]